MRYLFIDSKGPIIFEYQSFYNSDIYSVSITAGDSLNFGKQSFKESFKMYSVWIRSFADVTFQIDSFSKSEIQELYISLPNTTVSEELSTIKFEQNSMSSCEYLWFVDINTTSYVDIQKSSFNNDKNVTVGDNAFGGCNLLNYANIVAQNKDISYCAYGGCKGRRSSSNKDEDDKSQSSAKALGNIKIQTVYIGYSPNIIVSMSFLVNFMRKVRMFFGHIIPPPELVHSAIWVSDKDANDDTIGAVFVYGRYFNKYNYTAYLNDDGAKAYKMSFKEFKGRYHLNSPKKLKIHKEIMLFDFINEVIASGKWTAHDYNWPTNNCQHFTAKLIKILQASRITPNNNDWLEIPKPILVSLKQNEINKN